MWYNTNILAKRGNTMDVNPILTKELLKLRALPNIIGMDKNNADSDDTFSSILSDHLMTQTNAQSNIIPAQKAIKDMMSRLEQQVLPSYLTTPSAYASLIAESARRYNVDPSLIKSVIHAESDFNPHSVSSAGAKGLMQLMDGTAKELGVTDPFDPSQNINGGTKYLFSLLQRYSGNVAMAIAAYNAGPGRVDRLNVNSDAELRNRMEELPKETQGYVSKVLSLISQYA